MTKFQNVGKTDRIIRLAGGAVVALVAFFLLSGPLQIVGYVLAAIAVITGAVGFCGLYKLFGIKTY